MNIGVIFAGGVGSRMHLKDRPKQFLEIYNKPIIVHTIEHFQQNPEIDAVAVVCVAEWMDYFAALVEQYRLDKVKKVVPGGASGQLSIYNGLLAARELAGGEDAVVLIHDGVRPLISSELLTRNIRAVEEYGSSITCGVVTETIIEIDDGGEIKTVPDRAHSRVAKAPQSFRLSDILAAHERALAEGRTDFIDSCTIMRHYGYPLHTIDGPYENIKITTPEDFYTMRAVLQSREDRQFYALEQ